MGDGELLLERSRHCFVWSRNTSKKNQLLTLHCSRTWRYMLYIFFSDHTFLVYAFNFGGSISKRGDRMMMTTMCHSIFRNVAEVHSYEQMNSVYVCAIAVQL